MVVLHSRNRMSHQLTRLVFSLPPTRLLFFKTSADPDDPYRITDDTRSLGMVVCRGTQVRNCTAPAAAVTDL